MSVLEYELLQGYIQPEYLPGDFKPYTDYCRIKLKINRKQTSALFDKCIKIKFHPNESIYSSDKYTDAEINEIKKIPLFYTVGTYETWRTGSNAEDAGGGWDYSIYRKNDLYKWKRCYINSDCDITLTSDLFGDNENIYIYLSGGLQTASYKANVSWRYNSIPFNIEVTADNYVILGTSGINDLELEGNLCSLLYGNDQENWVWGKTDNDTRNYPVSFQNSYFTSVKNLVLNELDTLSSSACSYMFANNRYLRNIPDCMNQIYFSKLKKDDVYYRMFENCNSLEKISLNITEDASAYMTTPYVETFAGCNSLRNINITYNYDKTKSNPCGLRSCVYEEPFKECRLVEKVSFNMDSPLDSNNVDHGTRYFGDGNNLFQLGADVGEIIETKYVTFPKFIDGRIDPDGSSITDNDIATEGAKFFGYYCASNYWSGAEDWEVGKPNNPSMPNIGLGDYENSPLINVHLFVDASTGNDSVYIGQLKNIPSDTRYSGLIDKMHNFSKLDMNQSTSPYPVISIGSMDVFAFDEYIIGSVRNWDAGANAYITTLYKLYNCDSETYVKVTDIMNTNKTNYINSGDIATLCFKVLA